MYPLSLYYKVYPPPPQTELKFYIIVSVFLTQKAPLTLCGVGMSLPKQSILGNTIPPLFTRLKSAQVLTWKIAKVDTGSVAAMKDPK